MRRSIRNTLALLIVLTLTARAGARGGGGCFEAGTPIATPAGNVPIESLRPGDAVIGRGPTGNVVAHVAAVYAVMPDHFLRLDLGDVRLDVTDEHPFAVSPGVYVQASQLHAGDVVLRRTGDGLVSASIRSITTIPAVCPAYNLTVTPCENFFAADILVHNKGCFLPDTPVLRPDGSSVPISELRPGDTVLAFDEQLNPVPATVREVFAVDVDGHLSITTDRVTLAVTAEHPFYAGDGQFREAQTLLPGDSVYAFDGSSLVRQTIRSVKTVPGVVRVYNLHTDDPHTFFAAGIAVHNKGGGGGGGGGGHGGGFGGGFGSHAYGSGGGYGSSIDRWEWLCPVTFVILFVGYFVWSIVKQTRAALAPSPRSTGVELDHIHPVAAVRPRAEATERALAGLAATDPSAEPGRLRLLVNDTFTQLQQCWGKRNYDAMRPLLTPELFNQHNRQLNSMAEHHEINRIDGLRIESIDLVHVGKWSAGGELEFTAMVTAAARDYYVDDRTERFLRGDRFAARFQEFWTFRHEGNRWLLRQIEQTMESRKLTEPNDIGADSQPAGPAGPWSDRSAGDAAGRAMGLLQKWVRSDPMWNASRMIDRTAAVFTAAMLAQQADGRYPASTDDVFPSLASEAAAAVFRDRAAGVVTEYRNFDVRHVDIVAVRRYANRTRDQFVARVAAHAQVVVTKSGRVVRGDNDVVAFLRYAVMGRAGDRWKLLSIVTERDASSVLAAGNADGG